MGITVLEVFEDTKIWCLGSQFSGGPDSVMLMDLMILEVFSKLNHSMILWWKAFPKTVLIQYGSFCPFI